MNNNLPNYTIKGQGKPLLLIPGMEGHKEFWKYQVLEFSKHYQVIATDLPKRKPNLSSTIKDYANSIIAILDKENIEKIVIAGESFGGVVSQEIAINNPNRLQALILANTLYAPEYSNFGLNMFTLATFVHPFAFINIFPRRIKKQILNWVGSHNGFVMDSSPGNSLLSDYILDYGLSSGFGAYLDRLIAGLKVNYLDSLKKINVPTLFLRGQDDMVVSEKVVENFLDKIPDIELAVIKGAGHCCQQTSYTKTNIAILEWLKKIKY